MTLRVLLICAVSLTAHWAFMFWQQAHIRSLPEVKTLDDSARNHATVVAWFWVMFGSLFGNFAAGALAKLMGYRKAITLLLSAYFLSMLLCFSFEWSLQATLAWFMLIGACQGVFALFTICLPPLFPTLLRTTSAGFCYNFGRIVAAGGTVFFGLTSAGKLGDYRTALLYAGFLFAPAAWCALMLPEEKQTDDMIGQPAD